VGLRVDEPLGEIPVYLPEGADAPLAAVEPCRPSTAARGSAARRGAQGRGSVRSARRRLWSLGGGGLRDP